MISRACGNPDVLLTPHTYSANVRSFEQEQPSFAHGI